MMKKCLFAALILSYCACYNVSYQEKATTKSINKSIRSSGDLEFMTKNGTQYWIKVTYMDQYVIEGSGEFKRTGTGSRENFSGKVPLDSIDTVIYSEPLGMTSMVIDASALLIVWQTVNSMKGADPPQVSFAYPPLPYGSSCPFVYSHSDGRNIFEGEAFGTSLGRGMENESGIVLSGLKDIKNNPQIYITNERPETHYINSILLYAIESSQGQKIVLDPENNPWPVIRPLAPLKAVDHSNQTITDLIASGDKIYWESDLANISSASSLQDYIELEFFKENSTDEVSLIVSAINSELITSVFNSVFGFLGQDALPFLHRLENDAHMIALLKEWVKKCSLKAWVWDKDKWEFIGAFEPEANAVSFSRLLRFSVPDINNDFVKIRLTSLPDVWKIDAVALDQSELYPVESHKLRLKKIRGPNSTATLSAVVSADDKYTILLPGDSLFVEFEPSQKRFSTSYTYMIKVRGYLHEWLHHYSESHTFGNLFNSLTDLNRMEMLDFLMQHPKLLLPPIYADWKKIKWPNN